MNRSHWPLTIMNSSASLFGVLLPILLVRILSPEDVGGYKQFSLWLMVAPGILLIPGFLTGVPYWASRRREKPEELPLAGGVFFYWTLVCTLLIIGFASLLAAGMRIEHVTVYLLALCLFSSSYVRFYEEVLVAKNEIWRSAFLSAGFEIGRCLVILIVGYRARTLSAVLWACTVALLVKMFAVLVLCWRADIHRFRLRLSPELPRILKFVFPVSLAAALSIPQQYIDQLLLSRYLPPADFALYALGCLSLSPLYLFEASLGRVLVARVSNLLARKKTRTARTLFVAAQAELLSVIAPCALALAAFAEPTINLLYTERYNGASTYLAFFAFSYLLLCLPSSVVPRSAGRSAWLLGNSALFFVVSLLACAFYAVQGSSMGVLLAALAVQAFQRGVGMWKSSHILGYSLFSIFPVRAGLQILTISAVLALGVRLLRPYFGSGIAWMLITGPICLVLYGVLLSLSTNGVGLRIRRFIRRHMAPH